MLIRDKIVVTRIQATPKASSNSAPAPTRGAAVRDRAGRLPLRRRSPPRECVRSARPNRSNFRPIHPPTRRRTLLPTALRLSPSRPLFRSTRMPDTRPNMFPIIAYRDEAAAIEWLCSVFGFEKLMVVQGEDGAIVHAELKLGPGVIMPSAHRSESGKSPFESGIKPGVPTSTLMTPPSPPISPAPKPAGRHARTREPRLRRRLFGKGSRGLRMGFGSYYRQEIQDRRSRTLIPSGAQR